MLILLQLTTAYLVAEFVLRPLWRERYQRGPWRGAIAHCATHLVSALALINLGLDRRVVLAVLVLVAVHTTIESLSRRLGSGGWVAFLATQVIHLLGVAVAAELISPVRIISIQALQDSVLVSPRTYLIVSVYAAVVFGGGVLVQKVTETFLAKIEEKLLEVKPGLPKAGAYIGWVERFLVLSFVIAGYNEAVGFLLAVKALVRFPEIQEDKKGIFGEYFLVGTFTSISLALLGGLLLKRLLAGS